MVFLRSPEYVGQCALAMNCDKATSLESTSATTTYHRMTVDGVGIFYREAGPKDAPTIVLLHGFPSSSREFDTLIPLLATRYHLIAPDFPGFGQSEAPPPSSYVYTFDNLAKTISNLLDQLKINKYTFYLHDYGGPVGFRIISAHPERLQALIIQNANARIRRRALARSGPPLRNIGPTRKRIRKCSMRSCRSRPPNNVIRSAPHIATVIIPIPGLTNLPIYQGPDSARSRRICSTTIRRTLLRIRRGKRGRRGCASTSRRLWWSGGRTILRSLVQGRSVQARPAGGRDPSTRRWPFCIGREERRDRESYSCVLGKTFRLTGRHDVRCAA